LALGATSAGAEVTHPFLTKITKANGQSLGQPWAMTFDSSGNLFLADSLKRLIDKFDSTNTYTTQFGAGEFPENFTHSVAVNQATGVVYVGESGPEEVFAFKPIGGGEYELIQHVKLGGFLFVAVDNSSGPRSGDVYVVSGPSPSTAKIYPADAEGKLETESPESLTPPAGGFDLVEGGFGGVIVDASTGDVYLAEPGHKAVSKYDSSGALLGQLKGTESPAGSFEPISLALDEATGHLFVLDNAHKVVDELSGTGTYLGQIIGTGPNKSEQFKEPVGVAVQNAAVPSQGEIYVGELTTAAVDIFGGAPKLSLTVEKTGAGTGTITSSPAGIDCGETCAAEFAEGVEVTLTATPTGGSTFAGWSGACSGTSECKVTMNEAQEVKAEFTSAPGLSLTVEKTGTGTGTVTSSPAGIDCGETCAAEFAEGSEVTLTATPTGGSTFAGWSGACSGTSECKVTMNEAQEVKAEFTSTPAFSVSVEVGGEGGGTVTSTPTGIDCGSECSAEFAEGTKVTLTAAPAAGSHFTEWSGEGCPGSTATTCEFTVPGHAVEVKAEFAESTTVPLRVVKFGEGTVTSNPAGIACAAECFTETAELEPGNVTLTETPAAGYEFVGWIGCKATTPTTCEVALGVPSEVTASFLKAGKEGLQGPAGGEGKEGKEGKQGSTGPTGSAGAAGATGAQGPAGAAGAAGAAGEKGASGSTGPAGSVGAVGPIGPAGPAGADGKVQFVKCTTVKQGKKKVQKCTTKLVSGPLTLRAAIASAHATLSRHGVVYAAGVAHTNRGRLSLRLRSAHRLRQGRYTLTLTIGRGRHKQVRTQSFVLG
jgi:hypothetical protein